MEVKTEFYKVDYHPLADLSLAKRIADTLQKHYPNHLWAVHVNEEQGYILIKNFAISTRWGMLIKLKTIYDDPSLKSVVRYAGEFLERANMKRGEWNGEVPEYVEGLPQNYQPIGSLVI